MAVIRLAALRGVTNGPGAVRLVSTITNAGSPRAVMTCTGTISGGDSSQTISGTYSATGESVTNPGDTETGTFSMTYN